MDNRERGRSPSAGQANHISSHASASPHHPHLDPSFAAGDSVLTRNHYNALTTQPGPDPFGDPSFTQDGQQNASLYLSGAYADFNGQHKLQQPPIVPSQGDSIAAHTFLQSQGFQSSTGDSSAFPSFDFNAQQDFGQTTSLDPSVLSDFQGGDNAPMAAMQSHSPTPPHLLPEMAGQHSTSPSPQASPSYQQPTFARPRNTSESLDPSSAMFPQGQNEWTNMNAYRGHRRTPSDYSDYSSHSNQASPYMPTLDSFDANAHSSPLLNPSQDPTFNGGLGLEHFNLNENAVQQQQNYPSPGQSPHISPNLGPQQHALPPFTADNHFGINATMNGGQYVQTQNGMDMFSGQEAFPSLNNQHSPGTDMGNADQMSPPAINIDYAPPAGVMDTSRPGNDGEALSPPLRSESISHILEGMNSNLLVAQSRNRTRAKSDSMVRSRSPSQEIPARGRSPSLQPGMAGGDKLSPFDAPSSRHSSPSRGRSGSAGQGGRGRTSSNASDQRDYILNLAEPERSPSNGAKDGRIQKHPATFQCTLCPKKFTRAYNLRSHLRTHTDERPFVCTVCGKAFARQHDRKRHEGLHSGEKKFVCKGTLQSNSHWGCGRRFARADALGRHFRSEAGRICIKPLLDEEAAERHKQLLEQQQQQQMAAGMVAPAPMMPPPMDMMGNYIPQALLAQYPALAGIDWSTIPQGPPPEEDYSGRSSFDASSGGEYYEDLSEGEMGGYPDPSGGMGMNQMGMHQGMPMQAGPGAQYGNVYGNQAGDYLSDFEGR